MTLKDEEAKAFRRIIMTQEQEGFLSYAAQRYIWWKSAEDAIKYPQIVLAQVMNIGVWDDMCKLAKFFSKEELLNVLNSADIGQLNARSWHFWHNWISGEIPPMPKRNIV